MPNTPGSTNAAEVITSISTGKSRGNAVRITARRLRQRSHQRKTRATKPIPHTTQRAPGIQLTDEARAAAGTVKKETGAKGSLANSTTDDSPDPAIAGAVCHPKWLPTATRTEKGIRNFTDAASQIPYRICARFLLKASVSRAATAANSVDCHR